MFYFKISTLFKISCAYTECSCEKWKIMSSKELKRVQINYKKFCNCFMYICCFIKSTEPVWKEINNKKEFIFIFVKNENENAKQKKEERNVMSHFIYKGKTFQNINMDHLSKDNVSFWKQHMSQLSTILLDAWQTAFKTWINSNNMYHG